MRRLVCGIVGHDWQRMKARFMWQCDRCGVMYDWCHRLNGK